MNSDLEKSFLSVCKIASEYDLIRSSSGNLSIRDSENSMLIKGSGAWMRYMNREDISYCSWDNGNFNVLNSVKPSIEYPLHISVYKERADVTHVLHFQAPYATALSASDYSGNYDVIVEIPYYCYPIASIGYFPPGSSELADAIKNEIKNGANVIQMKNHGQVAVADSADKLLRRCIFFELACQIIVLSGNKARTII